MRIAQLAPIYERVPPRTYGGTELVVHLLTEELIRRGHEVTLFASGDSITSARLMAVTQRPHRYGDANGLRHPEYVQLANAQACFRAAARGTFDLIHNHAGIEGVVLAATSDTPVLTTTHLDWSDETASVWDAYPWTHHQVSAAQAAAYPSRGQLRPVHHGIDLGAIAARVTGPGEGDLLFLGRFTPVKGPHTAVAVARATGRRLVLAGKVDAADATWFDEHVRPQVDGDRVILAGEVDASRKAELLAGAAALLFPIEWDEPFGLVVVEAMAAGTPVIAFRRGSTPELVEHGVTGFVVDDADAMSAAVADLCAVDRAAVRRRAEERFSAQRMVDDIVDRYAATISLPRPFTLPAESSPETRAMRPHPAPR